ncbi:hypothetical protein L211DRAFT_895939, partial [Terfezia boudieri ATCC MYA-4762]
SHNHILSLNTSITHCGIQIIHNSRVVVNPPLFVLPHSLKQNPYLLGHHKRCIIISIHHPIFPCCHKTIQKLLFIPLLSQASLIASKHCLMPSSVELLFRCTMNTNFLSWTLIQSMTTNSSSPPVTLSTDTISICRHNCT